MSVVNLILVKVILWSVIKFVLIVQGNHILSSSVCQEACLMFPTLKKMLPLEWSYQEWRYPVCMVMKSST